MACGILVGLLLTEDELLAMRDAALSAFNEGGRHVTALAHGSGNGVQRSKAWDSIEGFSPNDVLREVKYALWKLDPEKWRDCAPGWKKSYARIV